MCKHEMIKINDIKICRKCGLTILPDGRFFYDKQILSKGGKNGLRVKNKVSRG